MYAAVSALLATRTAFARYDFFTPSDSSVLPLALPRPDSISQPLRIAFRSVCLLGYLAYGVALAGLVNLDFTRRLDAQQLASHWQRGLMRILGISVRVRGTPLRGGLMMANHVSWLDIPLIGAFSPTRFVSKAEVRDWPVAGWFANASGTFYLRRGKHGTRPLLDQLVPHLESGGSVTIFPEGTTSSGEDVLVFHSRLFAAAIESDAPVQPVALRYGPGSEGVNIAPFVGDDDLVSHVLRMLRNRHLTAELSYGEPILPAGHSRESLAQATRNSIRVALNLPSETGNLATAMAGVCSFIA